MFITSTKYDKSWKGTSEHFVLFWQDKVQQYDAYMTNVMDRFSNNQKMAMLQNTVHECTELHQVKINADIDTTKSGINLTYNQYTLLLLSAASALDKANQKSDVKDPK